MHITSQQRSGHINQCIMLSVFVTKKCKILHVTFVNCLFASLHVTSFRTAEVIFMRLYNGKVYKKSLHPDMFLLNSGKSNGKFT
jgi:hypothetical protein